MVATMRVFLRIAAVVTVLGFGALGCDAGGLILVDTKETPPPPKVAAHSSNEMVSAGTVAKNDKYTVVYTMGQPTPQSRVSASSKVPTTLNGGIVGATQPQ